MHLVGNVEGMLSQSKDCFVGLILIRITLTITALQTSMYREGHTHIVLDQENMERCTTPSGEHRRKDTGKMQGQYFLDNINNSVLFNKEAFMAWWMC